MASKPSWMDVMVVAAAKASVSVLVLALGFCAISDDDFARVVIAQSFVSSPRVDPSGSSWLPLPFWFQGLVMMLAGRTLEVARATAFFAGVLSALLVYVAARWLEVPRRGAAVAGIVGSLIPYAAWLGVATVPDGPTAALILLGAAASSCPDPRRRLLGGVALLAATLCRYESWPVAVGFAALTAVDAYRRRSKLLAAVALLPLTGAAAWMTHGLVNHDSPLFFVTRVAAYQRALGMAPESVVGRMLGYPLALLRCEPELIGLTTAAVLAVWLARQRPNVGRYRRPALLLATLLAFLVVGDLGQTAPTHHAERTLLAIWLMGAVLVADLGSRAWPALTRRRRAAVLALAALLVGAAVLVLRPWLGSRDGFVDRSAEVSIGRAARAFDLPGRLLVDTDDFGFYAVIAAFAKPERAAAFDTRDPRVRPRQDAFASTPALRERLSQEHAAWFVATQPHAAVAGAAGEVLTENAHLVLLAVKQ